MNLDDQLKRWVEYFQEFFNCFVLLGKLNILVVEVDFEISWDRLSRVYWFFKGWKSCRFRWNIC